jgi:hypothetical protein
MSLEDKEAFESLFPLPVRTAEKRCDQESERQGNSKRNKASWDNLGRS